MKKSKKKQIRNKLMKDKSFYKKLLVVVITIICVVVVSYKLMEKGNVLSQISSLFSSNLLKDQEVENLVFKNAQINDNKLTVEVEAKENISLSLIEVIYKDKNNDSITTLLGYVGDNIEKGEVKKLVVDTDEDLSNAYSIEYKIK